MISEDPFEGPGAQREDFEVSGPQAPKAVLDLTGKPRRRKPADFNKLQREWFEKHGYTFAKCEHKSAYDGRNHDLWTFGDWLAIRGAETLIVQTCAHSSASTRANKAKATQELWLWLAGANRRFAVHGWKQPAGKGTRWEVVIREVTLEDRTWALR